MSAAARPDGGLAAVYVGFLLTGAGTVILGPLRPAPAALSWLFLVQFAAHSLGAVLSSGNARRSLTVGHPLIAVGLAALIFGWPTALLAVAVMGFGLGLAIPATNILVAQRHPGRRAAALSHLNLLWGVGAISAPLVFAALRPTPWVSLAPLVLAVPAAVVAVALAIRTPEPIASAGDSGPTRVMSWSTIVFIAAQMFLYVGAESAVGAWVIALAKEYAPPRSVVPELVGAAFWLALLAGRAGAPAALRRVSEGALHRAGLGLAVVGAAVLLLSHGTTGLAIGAALSGLAFAPIFPILAATLVGYTQAVRPSAAGPVFAIAGFGAGAVPWLAGQIVIGAPTVRAALFVPAVAVVLLALLQGREAVGDGDTASAR